MALRLIVALPNPGCDGAPRGLFYPVTAEGLQRAEEFARQEDRPGWGVFQSMLTFGDDAGPETFDWILERNGIGRR
jgi:hypothetical protein